MRVNNNQKYISNRSPRSFYRQGCVYNDKVDDFMLDKYRLRTIKKIALLFKLSTQKKKNILNWKL